MRCAAVDVNGAALPAPALPLSKNPLRALPSPSFYLFIYIGRVGRVGREIAVVDWLLSCPTSALPRLR